VRRIAIVLVRGYQKAFSLLLGPRCRFHPTCSQYTIESIERFGTVRGMVLGFFRILRCQPLVEGGSTPSCYIPAPPLAAHAARIRRKIRVNDWLIRNALLVDETAARRPAHPRRAHRPGRRGNSRAAGERVFDANGASSCRHDRRPGALPRAGPRAQGRPVTESRAAVAGGITSFMEMPNTKPPACRWKRWPTSTNAHARARSRTCVLLGATNDNLEVIKRFTPSTAAASRCSWALRPATCWSTTRHARGDFREARTLVITHCEDTPTIDANLAAEKAKYGAALDATRHPYIPASRRA
jgi:putative membrane protein insertion efficiency factor